MADFIEDYLFNIGKVLAQDKKGEHSYRPYILTLLEAAKPSITTLNDPGQYEYGAPDVIVQRRGVEIGHIETKDVGKTLEREEQSEQMTRYRRALGNLILTDYLEFRWYVEGELRLVARIGDVSGKKVIPSSRGVEDLKTMMDGFFAYSARTITSSRQLAERMAAVASIINDQILDAMEHEDEDGAFRQQKHSFQRVLIPSLSEARFSDMYAQTICYGMFAARMAKPDDSDFSRMTAAYDLPDTNPFLRDIFEHIAGASLDKRVVWAVDYLAELLKHVNVQAIEKDFTKQGSGRTDPIIHFYETFLGKYNPQERVDMGVYYTPEPLVSYLVQSVDKILKRDFSLTHGLADTDKVEHQVGDEPPQRVHRVQVLDPACGTGTFLYEAVERIYEEVGRKSRGVWQSYVTEDLLPRLHGLEVLMAPYTIAHLKLAMLLHEQGYKAKQGHRLNVFLTNTLEPGFNIPPSDGFTNWIRTEAEAARVVKRDHPVMVVMGNPPYKGESQNKGKWIYDLLRGTEPDAGKMAADYFSVDGEPLGEKNPKWLNDDYVKFVRFAQWRVERTGYGVVALVTPHGYLTNPTFRGMRQSLMRSFDEIYVLDCHGNYKRREKTPDGGKDENVFKVIEQGIALSVMVKHSTSTEPAKVYHHDIWGSLKTEPQIVDGKPVRVIGKYDWLRENDVTTVDWDEAEPSSPMYLFVPQDADIKQEYEKGISVQKIFGESTAGFITSRDALSVATDRATLEARVEELIDETKTNDEVRRRYRLKDKPLWRLDDARQSLRAMADWRDRITACTYRPFDTRYCFYDTVLVERARPLLAEHVVGKDNECLLVSRQTGTADWHHAFVANLPSNDCALSTKSKELTHVFPLYLYGQESTDKGHERLFDVGAPKGALFNPDEQDGTSSVRRSNLSGEFTKMVELTYELKFISEGEGNLNTTVSASDILAYIFAVLSSRLFTERYAEFLRGDFPRIPLVSDKALFTELVQRGRTLVDLALMREVPKDIGVTFPEEGSGLIERVIWEPTDDDTGRIFINNAQFFDGVPVAAWDYQVGSHLILEAWLKGRKGTVVNLALMNEFSAIAAAVAQEDTTTDEIDDLIATAGGWATCVGEVLA